MYQYIILGIIGVGALILGNLKGKTEKKEKEIEKIRIKYYKNIEELEQKIIEEQTKTINGEENFDALRELHFQSFKNADYAYEVKKGSKSVISQKEKSIGEIEVEKIKIYNQLKNRFPKNYFTNNIKDIYIIQSKQNNCIEELEDLENKKNELKQIMNQKNNNIKQIIQQQKIIWDEIQSSKISDKIKQEKHKELSLLKANKEILLREKENMEKKLFDCIGRLKKRNYFNHKLEEIISSQEYKELISLEETKKLILKEIKNDKQKLYEFNVRVQEFNEITRELKEFIRDNCGNGGRIWYDRLEQRNANNRK